MPEFLNDTVTLSRIQFALGSIFEGINVDAQGHFIGGIFDWLTWRSIIVALTLVQGYVLIGLLLRSLKKKEETTPIIWTFLIFCVSFIGLGFIIFPKIIPPSITIYQAAAAPSSLVFMLTFIGFLIPILLSYNIYNYVVFRGKIADS
jgi:cytochrome bd-type quinol oxidase subunit 2